LVVAQTENRAVADPWAKARATMRRPVSWLAGHGTMHDLPRHAIGAQWRLQRSLVHRAIRSQLQGQPRLGQMSLPYRVPGLSPSRGTGAIFAAVSRGRRAA